MIYPSIYKFSAPYRGPKSRNEIDKLFTSIVYDLSIAYDELEKQASDSSNALSFLVSAEKDLPIKVRTSATIDGKSYVFNGIDSSLKSMSNNGLGMSQVINTMQARADRILESL